MYRQAPEKTGIVAILGGNRYPVPFNRGIATPVCELARNDSIFFRVHLQTPIRTIGFSKLNNKSLLESVRTHRVLTVREALMPPVGQYVFAETPRKTVHFTAGSGAPRSESELQ